jgi:uncharacterized protein
VLPAAASLRKQGANKGATTAFLIATPESGIDSITISYALLDPIMTVIRPVAALVTAIAAGALENTLSWHTAEAQLQTSLACPVDNCCDGIDCPDEIHNHHHSLGEKLAAGLRFALHDVWGDIALWFFVGLLAAALITVLIPESVMTGFLGGGFSSMLIMLVIGIPLYICASASTPIAAALILKGVSPGAALVFLLAGPATNLTSLPVLVRLLGRKGAIRYIIVLSVGAVAFGLGVDALYSWFGISPKASIGEAAEIMPAWLKLTGALLLILLSAQPLYRFFRRKCIKTQAPVQYFSGFPQVGATGKNSQSHIHRSGCGCGK